MSEFTTLVDLIEARKNEKQTGITFILNSTEEKFVSYRQMYQTSLKILYLLQSSGYKNGDEVVFQINDNEQFVYSFWACILGGMIPVPIPVGDNDEQKYKLFKIWRLLNNPQIIISNELLKALGAFAEKNELKNEFASMEKSAFSVNTDEIQASKYGNVHQPNSEDLAFIQFSSGSTGDPKGVMITHKNIFVNLSAVLKWDHYNSDDSSLCWLPLTHDMGLIGFHIKEVLADINQYNMSAQLFLSQPLLWLEKASEHKVTVLYSPNFGYKQVLTVYNPNVMPKMDLSNVRIIYNGAEPTSLDVNNEFLDKMSVYGLKRSSMRPVYGLAESTIAVAFPLIGEEFIYHALDRRHLSVGETVVNTAKDDINSVIYLDVGYPIYSCNVRITNEENKNIGENKIGYVQISGENVTSGYYNNKQATEEAMTADGWFNTGDLGFIRDRRLTITGRAKDVIFAAGQNFYSHDIERIAEQAKGVEPGKVAAAGIYNDRLNCDELVIFVKYEDKLENFIKIAVSLKRVISKKNGVDVSEVIPVNDIPKTSSGKFQRYKLRDNYINGEYDSVKRKIHSLMTEKAGKQEIAQPKTPVQKELVKIWSEILNCKNIGINEDFFERGGDSLKATQVISRVRERFQLEVKQAEIFENPTIESLASIIESAAQPENDTADEIKPITQESDKVQLSYAQQRLWFLDRLNLHSPQYNLSKGLVMKGKLNMEALKKSFNAIIRRHEILQAYFIEEDGLPVQLFSKQTEMPLKISDLRNIQEKDKKTKIIELAKKEASTPFNLEKAPLIRGNLLCVNEEEHILILSVHHIVFDGWSFGILLKELNYYYKEFITGGGQPLPELKIQYADFSRWQKENIKSRRLNNQLEYWKRQLGGNLPVLNLPFDKTRPSVQTYNGAKFTSFIPVELVDKVEKYAKKENATSFMVLLTAFNLLLYKYSGQTDITVGSPIANRNRKEIEDLIGFFTNNVVLRTRFSSEINFNGLLQKVKQVTVDAYSNQDVQFEKIVEELHIERDMSKNPLFQVLFGMQNTPVPAMEMPQLDVSFLDIDSGYSRFDLSVDIRNAGGGFAADFEYNTDLFNEDTVIRMAGHFNQLLSGAVKNPYLPIEDYDILTAEERKTILYDWNDTKEDLPDIISWTQLFEKQAALTPHAVAAVCGNQQMSYAELNENSNRVARYLQSCGVSSESIVGVYIDRSIDMLVGLLGIQKAGAAYLPMDPIFPKERLAYMLKDANVKIILSEKELSATLPKHNAKVICLDSEKKIISQCSAEGIPLKKASNNLAYVIYTSGSTGKPKGVQIKQRSLINVLMSFAKKVEIKANDSLLAVTTLSFDIAGLELYMPLICGAKVVIAQRDDVTDGNKLISILEQQKITVMQATPATWRLLIESGWTGSDNLKILCGGEALPKDLLNRLFKKCKMLINVYGPTETTIWSTMEIIEPEPQTVYIGKPIANTQVYVVDKSMNPVPIGVPGELLIGGDGLARGYMNLPELTKEKFIPDRFSKVNGALLYRTGDVVKFNSNGKLECIGRKDNQVKIRGFRIELGEIEALINMEQSVKESIVVAKELIPGEYSLAAYIIPLSEKVDIESIRKNLREKLPNYMLPTYYMEIKSFPMTPNGKIDRKALPLPKRNNTAGTADLTVPSSEIEKQLQAIWKEVLKLDEIDINRNFFDLGGHSLLMAQVKSRIKSVLNKEVSMLDLFKYPTIASLAAYISGNSLTVNKAVKERNNKAQSHKIAIIGLSGRFPGAKNIDEFWHNLCSGVSSISHFTDEQVIEAGVSPEMVKKSEYVKAWGILDNIDLFDAQFFGYNPREAEVLDPQQRVFLEQSWNALEDAGCDTNKFNGTVGVFGSVGRNTYAQNLKSAGESNGLADDYQIMISNDKDFLATRIGYKLNLGGPCLTVQTACSSSLVAVHMACRSLLNGECDMALAGGVSIKMPQKAGYLYQEGMILSPDGDCRAFDERAKGTVGGNGAGVVVLKRFEDAVADGDNISAVILGSAVNNDGALKIGYTAPSVDGQAKVIAKAQANAGIEPDSVTYVEAHGTGTPLGDPIEVEALTQAFSKRTDKKGFCAIGSVKTNIGHLDAAAGAAGLIKTVLCLRNKTIPPIVGFNRPNPKINFKESPFFIDQSLTAWSNGTKPLRAGVSAFGIGGTNAHVILEEAPVFNSDPMNDKPLLFVLSAKSQKALDNMTANLAEFLGKHINVNLADIAYTLQSGRKEFEYRRFFIASSVEEVLGILKNTSGNSEKAFDSIGKVHKNADALLDNPEDYPLERLGKMWLDGVCINWKKLYSGQKRKRVPLPTYPFEKRSFWVDKNVTAKSAAPAPMIKRAGISEMFYTPVWKQSVDSGSYGIENDRAKGVLLVLADSSEFLDAFEDGLRKRNANIIVALTGKEYKAYGGNKYTFDPENPAHYDKLTGELLKTGKTPVIIADLLGFGKAENRLYFGERLLFSMMFIAQAIGRNGIAVPVQLKVFSTGSQRIFNEQDNNPENALHLGACRVIPNEYPNIKCCSVDCSLPEKGSAQELELIDLLIDELYFMPCDGVVAYRGMQRWKQSFERLPIVKNSRGIRLKNDGVYIITGGVGGIGLETAQFISDEAAGVKLVLASRSAFPEQEQWDNWIKTHNIKDRVSQKIIKLQKIASSGAEIYICQTDVTQKYQMDRLRETVMDKYGKISGVIHAAGQPGGGMIQLKKKEQAEKVLSPKVHGAINLYEAFKECKLDFVLLYSSLNAITGGFGQMDYSAANAFLDAFAQTHDSYGNTRFISIDWDRWPGIGMAASNTLEKGSQTDTLHPLLGKCIINDGKKFVYTAELSPENDWVLSEHLILGTPTIAGTTYLEMVRAAFEDITQNSKADISDVLFLNPLSVKYGDKRNVYTVMEKAGEAYTFQILSSNESDTDWLEHIHGKIAFPSNSGGTVFELEDLKRKCGSKTIYSQNGQRKIPENFISFGGRWRSLKSFTVFGSEGLAQAQLDRAFIKDTETYKLHPALLDVVTGAVRLAAQGNYLPFAYEKLEMYEMLPDKIYSYIRFKNGYDKSAEIISCDIDIIGENGKQLIKIKKFSMKLVSEASAENIRKRNYNDSHENPIGIKFAGDILNTRKSGLLQEGITVAEGLEALRDIINGCLKPQVIVSSKDIKSAIEQAGYINQPMFKNTLALTSETKARHPRPEMENEYVPPKNETEKKLVNLWQNVLAIDKIGIYDDFFALGGDSLLLIQFHTKLKENFETDIAVVDLYKYNTIAALAEYLNRGNAEEEQPVFDEVNARVSKQKELMKKRRAQMHRTKGVNTNE